MKLDKKSLIHIKRGVRVFLIISVISITIILIITVRKETFSSLRQLNPFFLFLTLIVCLFRIYLECLRLQTLTWAFGKWINVKRSAEFTVGGYFLSLAPFGVGGLPLQLYILIKEKFSPGKSGAIIGMRGIAWIIAFAFGIPILIGSREIFEGSGVRFLSRYLTGLYGVFFVLLLLVMIRTERVKYRLSKISRFFLNHKKRKIGEWITKLGDEIDKFKFGLKECWGKGIYKLILTIFISGVSLFVYTLIAPLLFIGMGISVPFMKTAITQFLLTFLLMFVPTPGGSGIAEGAGFALYKDICTKPELLGIYVILWRFFTYYVGVILGGLIILKMLVEKKRDV